MNPTLTIKGERSMNIFLIFAFLFFIGSVFGWILELFYRRFFSRNNPERKWINPGFCIGPYLPLYGTGLCFLYLIASIQKYSPEADEPWHTIFMLIVMILTMTIIEYIAGFISLRCFHVRLWDYSEEWANIQGIICPKFSLFWGILGTVYYYLVHPYILDALMWLSENLAFSFIIGMFFGFFIIDAVYSTKLIARLKRYADENEVIVRYEQLKSRIRSFQDEQKSKYHFFRPLHSERTIAEHINDLKDTFEKMKDFRNKI